MSDELKPCPFCGGPALSGQGVELLARMVGCDCEIEPWTQEHVVPEEAAAIWNARPSEDAARAEGRPEGLKEALEIAQRSMNEALSWAEDDKAAKTVKHLTVGCFGAIGIRIEALIKGE